MKTNLFTTLAFSAMLTLANLTSNAQTPVLDQQNIGSNTNATFFAGQTFGQSFTAGLTGSLTSVSIGLNFGAPTTPCVVKVFSGSGFGGTLLATKNFTTTGPGFNTVTLSTPISITSGSVYTYQFSSFTASIPVNFHSANPYAGGAFFNNGVSTGSDAIFQTFVAVPSTTTQLLPAYCGTTLVTLSDRLKCKIVPSTTKYEWEVTDVLTNTVYLKQSANSLADMYLSYIPQVTYNKTYSIRVRAYTSGSWGVFSGSCLVTTPLSASTKLQSVYCGTTLNTLSDKLKCDLVAGATKYEWEVTDIATGTPYLKQSSGSTNNVDMYLSYITQVTYGKSYSIRVRAYSGGVWGTFGTACTVTTPASGARARFAASDYEETEIGTNINVNAYPNPTTELLNVDFDNIPANASVEIYNMIGELVLNQTLTGLNNTINTSQLSNGLYHAKVIGNNKLLFAQKIVKQ